MTLWRQKYGTALITYLRTTKNPALLAIYVSFALFALLITVFLTPPFQIPDEPAHFQRAIQVSQGGIRGVMSGPEAGGYLPGHLQSVLHMFDDLPFHPERKATPQRIDDKAPLGWDRSFAFQGFPNTVTYGPAAYAPGAFGVMLGRNFRMSIIQTSYLSRLANGVVFLCCATFALMLCRRGNAFLFVILSMPMTIFLAGSISEDGVVIGLSALLASILTRYQRTIVWSWRVWAALGLGFAIISMAKPPLLALPLAVCFMVGRRDMLSALLCPLVATALTFGWLVWGVSPVKVQLLAGSEYSDAGQVHYILSHPIAVAHVLRNTLHVHWNDFWFQFVGVLGWLDAPFQPWFYRWTKLVFIAAILVALPLPTRETTLREFGIGAARRVGIGGTILLSMIGIFLSLYVIWTKVGAPVIEGVQGRYLIPGACFLILMAPPSAPTLRNSRFKTMCNVATVGAAAWAVTVFGTYTHLLAVRFW